MMLGGFDIGKLREDANYRWLKPSEVFYILQNHEKFEVTDVTPKEPPSGSLLLFNRRVNRYFRKDGYAWQKKKDGRSVGEAHEHLKVGDIEALNCYYARVEQNPYFQRRCYWILDPRFDHIVLVHYREVSEGRYNYQSNVSPDTFPAGEGSSDSSDAQNRLSYMDSDDKSGTSRVLEGVCSISHESVENLKMNNTVRTPELHSLGRDDLRISGDIVTQPFQSGHLSYPIIQQHLDDDLSELYFGADNNSVHERNLDAYSGHDHEFVRMAENTMIDVARNVQGIDTIEFEDRHRNSFIIREISPEQSYSKNTKVFIIGDFPNLSLGHPFVAMFDETEVPFQIIQNGVLCCQVPDHVPGKVKLCITSGNRNCCSNVREFEYLGDLEMISKCDPSGPNKTASLSELELLVKLAMILLCEHDCIKAGVDLQWDKTGNGITAGNERVLDSVKLVLQELVKDKLKCWLSSKLEASNDTSFSLSKDEKCVIHMISGLGFEWALAPLLDLKAGINFRDNNGWTALHWAARFGREEMVDALIAAGASPGAVTDPTRNDAVGRTPASIAETNGHKGLAGYLSEVALERHLSSLTIGETERSQECAASDAKKTLQTAAEKLAQISSVAPEDQLSLEDSLKAFRNAAQTAARILSAFRSLSLKMRQQRTFVVCDDEYGLTSAEYQSISAWSNQEKTSHDAKDKRFHKAALQIQKKYRGWTGRRHFLTLRQNAVKIQAHVRGYQVRKKYRELLRCVNIIDKIMLRWRRHRTGLRGFRGSNETEEAEEDDVLKAFRKQKVDAALDKDLKRVLSMVGSAGSRQQYIRMVNRKLQRMKNIGGDDTSSSEQSDDIESLFLQDFPPFSPSLYEPIIYNDLRQVTTGNDDFFLDALW